MQPRSTARSPLYRTVVVQFGRSPGDPLPFAPTFRAGFHAFFPPFPHKSSRRQISGSHNSPRPRPAPVLPSNVLEYSTQWTPEAGDTGPGVLWQFSDLTETGHETVSPVQSRRREVRLQSSLLSTESEPSVVRVTPLLPAVGGKPQQPRPIRDLSGHEQHRTGSFWQSGRSTTFWNELKPVLGLSSGRTDSSMPWALVRISHEALL